MEVRSVRFDSNISDGELREFFGAELIEEVTRGSWMSDVIAIMPKIAWSSGNIHSHSRWSLLRSQFSGISFEQAASVAG